MILSYINWDVDPEIFRFGFLAIRWYSLFFALAFIFGFLYLKKVFAQEKVPLSELDSLSVYMFVGTILGARLGHVLFYQPEYYMSHPLEIIQIWKGGLASHGAAVGILLSLYFFSRKFNKKYLWTLDRIVIVVALAGFFIRMGNLMNSEIVGKVTEKAWGFVFVREIPYLGDAARHPAQIYEALSYLSLFFILNYLFKHKKQAEGFVFGLFLVILFSMRFVIEFFKDSQVSFEDNMSLNMGQILSIPFVIIGIVLLLKNKKTLSK